ncbi:hypothetical protein Hanom_Chr11g00991771 [Helianthus anomalus]
MNQGFNLMFILSLSKYNQSINLVVWSKYITPHLTRLKLVHLPLTTYKVRHHVTAMKKTPPTIEESEAFQHSDESSDSDGLVLEHEIPPQYESSNVPQHPQGNVNNFVNNMKMMKWISRVHNSHTLFGMAYIGSSAEFAITNGFLCRISKKIAITNGYGSFKMIEVLHILIIPATNLHLI